MPEWRFIMLTFDPKVGGDKALYERILSDGTRLIARVRNDGGRPLCDEITATFPAGARDFGRELAISELERVINDNDQFWFRDARTGERVSFFALSEIPVGVPVAGSRGRKGRWTDKLLAELVHDLEIGDTAHWHLERNTIRQRANQAVRRGIAELADSRPPKSWRLTARGRLLILESEDNSAATNG
jgi:hypothetical protein